MKDGAQNSGEVEAPRAAEEFFTAKDAEVSRRHEQNERDSPLCPRPCLAAVRAGGAAFSACAGEDLPSRGLDKRTLIAL